MVTLAASPLYPTLRRASTAVILRAPWLPLFAPLSFTCFEPLVQPEILLIALILILWVIFSDRIEHS